MQHTNPKLAKAACTCKMRRSTSVNSGWIIESSEGCPQHDDKLGAGKQEEAAEPRADGWCIARHDKHGPCVLRLGHDGPHDWARHISQGAHMTDTERKLIELLKRALPYVRRQTYPGNSPSTLSLAIELQTDIQDAIDAADTAAQAERGE